jgi:hypothetical protein
MIDLSDRPTSSRLVNQFQIYLLCEKTQSEVNALIGTRASGGKPKAISPEGVYALALSTSPDGQLVVGIGPDQKGYLYPSAGGEPRMSAAAKMGAIVAGQLVQSRQRSMATKRGPALKKSFLAFVFLS